jgi:hypothetical protein
VGRFATAQSGVEPCGLRIGGLSKLEAQNLEDPRQKNAPLMSVICDQRAIAEDARMIGRGGGIELLFHFTKSRVFTVLPTASQINSSQMEPTDTVASRNSTEGSPDSRAAVRKAQRCIASGV